MYNLRCSQFPLFAMLFKKKSLLPPNFLAGFSFDSVQSELEMGALFFFSFCCILLLFPLQYFQGLGILLLALLLLVAVLIKIEWGIYALGIFAFFQGWEFAFSDYQLTRNIAFLSSLNAPLVDFIALVLLPCSIIALFVQASKRKFSWAHLRWPAFWYASFLLIGLVSAMHANILPHSASIKFLLRPMLFVFLSYILLPHFFLQSQTALHRLLTLWFWIGCAIALFGLSSLLVVQGAGWVRIQPYGIGSFAPLGVNHNLIAEVLVALIPIGFWLMWQERKNNPEAPFQILSFYFVGTGLMTLVALGTLSRAAWITLFVEGVAFSLLFQDEFKILWNRVKHLLMPFFILGVILFLYMTVFLTSNVVRSSDSSRIEVTKIVSFYVNRSPLFGYGPGSFMPIIQDTYVHTVEFGDALDAHGFIQKILLEEGWLGFICFAAFLLSVLFLLYQEQKKSTEMLPKFLFVMAVGAMVFQLFNTSYFNSVLWMPLGVALTNIGVQRKKISFQK